MAYIIFLRAGELNDDRVDYFLDILKMTEYIKARRARLENAPNTMTLYYPTSEEDACDILESMHSKIYPGLVGHLGAGVYFAQSESD